MKPSKKRNDKNPKAIVTRIELLAKGLRQEFPPDKPLDVKGNSTPAGQIATNLDGRAGKYTATDAAHTTYEGVKKDRDESEPDTLAYVEAVEDAIRANIGADDPKLKNFGMQPRKRASRSTAAKADSAAKAAETRKAEDAALAKPATPPPSAGPTPPSAGPTPPAPGGHTP